MKDRTVISTSERKNIQMVIYHNVDADGKKFSITRHEPLRSDRNHYKRFVRSSRDIVPGGVK